MISRIADTSTSSDSGNPAADRRDCLRVIMLIGIPLDLVDDRQPLLTATLDGEGRRAARLERRVASLGRPLNVLRVNVSPAQDDHVLDPARDEELAVLQEAQVAGPEELLDRRPGRLA